VQKKKRLFSLAAKSALAVHLLLASAAM